MSPIITSACAVCVSVPDPRCTIPDFEPLVQEVLLTVRKFKDDVAELLHANVIAPPEKMRAPQPIALNGLKNKENHVTYRSQTKSCYQTTT